MRITKTAKDWIGIKLTSDLSKPREQFPHENLQNIAQRKIEVGFRRFKEPELVQEESRLELTLFIHLFYNL